jgi:hypothetical protein
MVYHDSVEPVAIKDSKKRGSVVGSRFILALPKDINPKVPSLTQNMFSKDMFLKKNKT